MRRRKRKLVIHDLSEDEGQYCEEIPEDDVFLDIVLKYTGRLIYFMVIAVLFILAGIAVVVLLNDTTREALLQLLSNKKI